MPAPTESPAAAFPWPPLPGSANRPRWTGAGFAVGGAGEVVPMLSYVVERSGWSDELTAMHEADAGRDHPIDLASRGRAVAEVAGHIPADGVVLDVGCSSGWLLSDLRRELPRALVLGADFVAGPLRQLAKTDPTQPLLQLDLTRSPLPDACLDAIVALNVLEHIEDDARAVAEMHRMLKPGGVAVIEVPAGPGLYDVFDKVLMHHRRYTRDGATSLFTRAGFTVERASHLGFFVYPAFAAVKLRNKRHLRKTEDEQRRITRSLIRATKASTAMKLVMALESAVGRAVDYPVGVRVTFTAIKR
jgi:SAM-dependent methyltransferase